MHDAYFELVLFLVFFMTYIWNKWPIRSCHVSLLRLGYIYMLCLGLEKRNK